MAIFDRRRPNPAYDAATNPSVPETLPITNYGIATVDWTKWRLTLSRGEMEETVNRTLTSVGMAKDPQPSETVKREEDLLTAAEFTIPIPNNMVSISFDPVDRVRGSLIQNVTLTQALTNLNINPIEGRHYDSIPATTDFVEIPEKELPDIIIHAINPDYQNYVKSVLNQIRSLIDTRLTEEDLPDSIIEGSVFLREAEMQVLMVLSEDLSAPLDSFFSLEDNKKERAIISIMYRAAAILLYSNPQIIQQSFERSGIRFAQVDIDEKYNFLIKFGDDVIDPILPPDRDPVGTVTVSELINRKLCW